MESCLLCLEKHTDKLNCIRTESKKWLELNIANTIEKHFWPLSTIQFNSFICSSCWKLVDDFHKFYLRVEEAHTKLIKVEKDNINDDFCFQMPTTDQSIEEINTDVNIKNEPLDLDEDMQSTSDISSKQILEGEKDFLPSLVNVGRCRKRKLSIEKSLEMKRKSEDFNDESESASDIDEDNSEDNSESDTDSSDRDHGACEENDKVILDYLKQINCNICKSQLDNFSALSEHYLKSHQQKGYILCCNRKFFRQNDLADHIHCHLNPNYFKCGQCDKMFSTRIYLEQHKCEYNSEQTAKQHSCDVCNKAFLNAQSLKMHKLSHLRRTDTNNSSKERNKLTNLNKLNAKQKELMAEFMNEHQDLAKNLIPNCAQGKMTANRLWNELTKRLNAVGPPVKDVKVWKKVYSDQKYQAKKKLFFNKLAKKRAAGGPYEEKLLTFDEELLIEAAGLKEAVEGSQSVPRFGIPEVLYPDDSHHDSVDSIGDLDESCSSTKGLEHKTKPLKNESGVDQKLTLLEKNIKDATIFQTGVDAKLDRLLEIQEQLLRIQKERHNVYMTVAQLDIKIKRKQLDSLQKNMKI